MIPQSYTVCSSNPLKNAEAVDVSLKRIGQMKLDAFNFHPQIITGNLEKEDSNLSNRN